MAPPTSSSAGTPRRLSGVELVAIPFVFTQSDPLTTSLLNKEAERRGLRLDSGVLQMLHQRACMRPIVEILSEGSEERLPGSVSSGHLPTDLHLAREQGRLRDPDAGPSLPGLRFDERTLSDPRRWWNGLVYSRWQLLAIPFLRECLTSSEPTEHTLKSASHQRRWAIVLSALEARYLPVLQPDWIRLSGLDVDKWEEFRRSWSAIGVSQQLGVTGPEAQAEAERLLSLARRHDPNGQWSRLICRAPQDKWRTLSGAALLSLEMRIAAEILLLFTDDLALGGAATPVLRPGGQAWHPLHERLSAHDDTPLDDLLTDLGVSPHPRLVLAIEGETEELLVPRVFDALGLPQAPDLVHVLCMRSTTKDLGPAAAFAVTPLVGRRHGDTYDLIKPLTRLYIAVDPEAPYDSQTAVRRVRNNIIGMIRGAVAAQGAELDGDDLDDLVKIRTWPHGCFEYSHFTDEQLANALMQVHPTCGGHDKVALMRMLKRHRDAGHDIKAVWSNGWGSKPSKPALAEALWPALREHIAAALNGDGPVPPIAEVVDEAYHLAQETRHHRYVLRASPSSSP